MAHENELQDRIEYGQTGPVVKFDATSAALSALQHTYKGIVFDCSNPSQDKLARQARRECVSLRTALEEARKALKKPLLDAGKALDEKANALKAAIKAVEDPIDAQIGAEEARKEAIEIEEQKREFERVQAIRERIRAIERVRVDALTMTDEQIRVSLSADPFCAKHWAEFDEFADAAEAAHRQTIEALRSILAQRERDAENERLRALVAEQAEQLAALTPKALVAQVEPNPASYESAQSAFSDHFTANSLPQILQLEQALKAAADELIIAARDACEFLVTHKANAPITKRLSNALQQFDKLHAELY